MPAVPTLAQGSAHEHPANLRVGRETGHLAGAENYGQLTVRVKEVEAVMAVLTESLAVRVTV
jgi:hypothetical protein